MINEDVKKQKAQEWLEGNTSLADLRKVLSNEEVKDLKFGKRWVEEVVNEI